MKPSFYVLLLFCLSAPAAQGQKGKTSARLGDFELTVTAARIASDQDIQDYVLHPPAGYKVALVFVRLKNVARYSSCSQLQEWMHVKQGYEYPQSDSGRLTHPKTVNVLPTDESSGAFAFQIKNGTEPAALRIVREPIVDRFCASSQHRQTQNSGPESVSLSLLGLPAKPD
jgi:hypothetical protein